MTLSPTGTARFNVALALGHPDRTAVARVAIYPRIIMRSQITPIVSGAGSSSPSLATTGNFQLRCPLRGPQTFTVAIFTRAPAHYPPHCGSREPQLRLACNSQTCDGVYPLSYTVASHGTTTTKWSLIAVMSAAVNAPLHLDWISTLGPSAWHHPVRTIDTLQTFAKYPNVPLTLTADYRTLSDAFASTTDTAAAWRGALTRALASPLHRVINAPPSTIDFGGLAAHGFAVQVSSQLSLASELLGSLSGRYVDGPVLLSATPSPTSLRALAHAGVSNVVVPESALAVAPSSTLTWGSPFHFEGIVSPTALSIDGPLSQLASDTQIEPGRRAALSLATLAFLHYEEPNAPATRTVVVASPVAATSVAFVNDLFSGLAHDPFVVTSSLVPSFTSSLVGTNGAPAARELAPATSSPWSARNTSTLQTLSVDVNSYANAVTAKSVSSALRVDLALSESTGSSQARQSGLERTSTFLASQFNNFSIDPSTITLTGPGTALPITLFSRANYPIKAVVHLITDRMTFPKGSTIDALLGAPTTSLRAPTSDHRGSSLTLQIVLTTPDDQVVLARTAIQVHIAGTSVVGYLLTFASLGVLGFWWFRSYRRGAKGRHAR